MKLGLDSKIKSCAAQNKCCGSCSACANSKSGVHGFASPLVKLVSAMGVRATFQGLKIFFKKLD
ncbi:MAG: hypothetical protein SPI34_04520 [Opitutales bacterium]|nr:hypothetical protein [Opitutales bacterium]